MDIISLFLVLLLLLVLVISILFLRRPAKLQLPPGPRPFPIIGNVHQIGSQAHRSMHKLSQTYGPIMSLYFGNKLAVVVSSPEIAKEVVKTHDRAFSGRFTPAAMKVHDHHKYSMGFLPANKEWLKQRKICNENMFSTQCLDSSQELRQEMMKKLCNYLEKCSIRGSAIDVGEAAYVTTLNLTSATLFSKFVTDYESEDVPEFRQIIDGVANSVSAPNIADLFPILRPFDPQGIKKAAEMTFGKLLKMFDDMIRQRLETRRSHAGDGNKKSDMLEALVDAMERSDGEFTIDGIKHLLVALYVAGTESTSSTIEWIITELLRHPDMMLRIQDEIRTVVGENNQVQESDMSNLPYMRAFIKEALRHHPPGIFLLPRESEHDLEINGYLIPKGSQVLVNIFAISRDPQAWSDPEIFDPERFMGHKKNIEFRGQDFQFLPFGSGRRMCPGFPFANRLMHLMTANLVHKFNWKLEPGMKPADLDMTEIVKLALKKKKHLMAIPVKP